jgi:galactonate dehydratase
MRPPMTSVSRTRFHIHASQLRGLAGELGHVWGGADKFAGAFRAKGRGQYRSYKKLICRSKPNLYSATRVGAITLLYASPLYYRDQRRRNHYQYFQYGAANAVDVEIDVLRKVGKCIASRFRRPAGPIHPIAMRPPMTSLFERRRPLLRFAESPAPAAIATSPHAISEVRGFQMSSGLGNSYVVLQVRTQSGLVGYGECNSLSGSDLRATNQAVVGRAASSYQALDGLAPPAVRGGLNIALLDIVGKATQAPIYRVLGGPTRNKARAITRLSGSTDEELQSDLQKQLAAGFRAFLIPIPPPTARNQGSDFVRAGVTRMQAMRASALDADFALEARAQLTPGDAASLAAAVERLHPLWFDEPCTVSNLETIRKIADETVVPLGFGRTIYDPGTFQDLLREGLIDLLRPDILTHGITGIRRLSAMAETYYVDVAPWHEGGPIATAAALHAAASIPNFFIAQSPGSTEGATLHDGFFDLPKGPGLGITVDEKMLEGKRIA